MNEPWVVDEILKIKRGETPVVPKKHATTHATGGTDVLSLTGEQIASGTVAAARIAPLDASKITSGVFDSARIPDIPTKTHASTHATGGTDPITPASIGAATGSHTHAFSAITDKPSTYPPATHTHAYNDLTSIPSTFPPATHSHAYADITGKPSTFTPAAHASTHSTGGTDAITPANIGAAAANHTHSDIGEQSFNMIPYDTGEADPDDKFCFVVDTDIDNHGIGIHKKEYTVNILTTFSGRGHVFTYNPSRKLTGAISPLNAHRVDVDAGTLTLSVYGYNKSGKVFLIETFDFTVAQGAYLFQSGSSTSDTYVYARNVTMPSSGVYGLFFKYTVSDHSTSYGNTLPGWVYWLEEEAS